MLVYAFLYAFFRSIIPREDRGNWGPLLSTLQGLIDGLFMKISNSHKANFK